MIEIEIEIETQRLRLRKFRAGDAEDLFAYLHQPVARCFLSMALVDMTAARIEAAKRAEGDESIAICTKSDDRVIGDLFAMFEEPDTFSVGWNLNPHFGGQGYAHEAAHALFKRLFSSGRARRLYAYVEDDNFASQRLCERLGMRREGVFREFVSFVNDAAGTPVYETTLQYALLRWEWDQLPQKPTP